MDHTTLSMSGIEILFYQCWHENLIPSIFFGDNIVRFKFEMLRPKKKAVFLVILVTLILTLIFSAYLKVVIAIFGQELLKSVTCSI